MKPYLFLAILLSTGCGSNNALLQQLADKDWHLRALGDTPAAGATLRFDSNGKVGGTGGCNGYSGKYKLSGKSLTFADINSSTMACPGNMDTETNFFQWLHQARSLELQGDSLLLIDCGGTGKMTLSK